MTRAALLLAVALNVGLASAQTLRYGTFVNTDVTFTTSDSMLQDVYSAAAANEANLIYTQGGYRVLVEGGGYNSCWIETQPMGGAMYAKRDLEVALNNQVLFIDNQRADGRLPAAVNDGAPDYGRLQGYCFPTPAWKMYSHIGKSRPYLDTLYQALVRHDNYLWATRDLDHDGVLEANSVSDMGEDAGRRYDGVSLPVECMDIMGYSYDGRNTLAKIAGILGNGQQALWRSRADSVKTTLAATLWDASSHACYDRNVSHVRLATLVHNNLRCMYHGVFSQQMADEFIRHHLLNRAEFWSPMPLVSIALSDPKFLSVDGNDWNGQPEGLTFQRTLVALQNYGHLAELQPIADKLIASLGYFCRFYQQWDPYSGLPNWSEDNYRWTYGPAQLAVMEYVADLYGVQLDEDTLYWSGLARGSCTQEYTQTWGANQYRIRVSGGAATGFINSTQVFSCTPGVRLVTDLAGNVVRAIGLDTAASRSISLTAGGSTYQFVIHPNEVMARSGSSFVSVRRVAFDHDGWVQPGRPWGPVAVDRWSNHAIQVHWFEHFPDQSRFDIDRADDSLFAVNAATFTAAAGATRYVDTTVAAGRTYYYRVRVTGNLGQSGYSRPVRATAQDPWLSEFDRFVLRGSGAYDTNRTLDHNTMTLNGVTFAKGIGTHAPCRLTYDLGGLYTRFQAQVGIDDEVGAHGTVTFSVLLDNDTTPVFASGQMVGGAQRKAVDIDLIGHQQMTLVVTDGGDNNGWDHAEWADARLIGVAVVGVIGQSAKPAAPMLRPIIAALPGQVVVSNLGSAAWTVSLMDVSGRVVEKRSTAGADVLRLSLHGRATGLYVVTLQGPVARRQVLLCRSLPAQR